MMTPIFSNYMVSYADLIENPGKVTLDAGNDAVAIIVDSQPLFYMLAPSAYEALLNQSANQSIEVNQSNSDQSAVLNQSNRAKMQQLALLSKSDLPPPDLELTHCFESHISGFLSQEALRVKRNELTQKSYQIIFYRLHKYILPSFGKVPITEINNTKLEQFVKILTDAGIGGVAIAQYLAIIRKVLKNALLKQDIDSMPHFPTVLGKRKSRGGFTIKEYLTLLQTSWRMRNQEFLYQNNRHLNAMGLDRRYMVMSEELHYLIGFMANSFVRPSDIKLMQHKHIQVINNGHSYLRLTLPETKKHGKPIVTMRRAVSIYQKLLANSQKAGFGRPDDYVFLPEIESRPYAMRILGFLFNWLLFETNLKTGPHNTPRTLYSLRHTSITFRLLYGQGIDMLTLARNARTSVNMIEKHYASTLSGEMNIDLLQSKRKVKAK